MKHIIRLSLFVFGQFLALQIMAQPYFVETATISGNNIVIKIKPVNGSITCGWSDIEFFFRNGTGAPNADAAFTAATITVNTTHFPSVSIPYTGINLQGTEVNYNTYWFGVSFFPTTPQTYNQNQEYTICTITLSSSPSGFELELCHNEPNFTPHYVVLTDESGADKSNLTGTCKFYGPYATICEPDNCPNTTPGNNHILPLNGPLPVELVDFQARKYGDHVARLDWRTAIEINFEAFEVERQHGGNWAQIGKEPAKAVGGSGATYTFYDVNTTAEEELYRLKMVDFDGTFEYSPVRSVQFDGEKTMRIFPNPATDVLYLQYGADMEEEDLQIELYDWTGRIVLQKNVAVSPGSTGVLYLSNYRLPAGVYRFNAGSANGFLFSQSIVIPIF